MSRPNYRDLFVIPAKAGIQWPTCPQFWIPAFAGMTLRIFNSELGDHQRPAWLDPAHGRVDEAVFAAFAWNPAMPDEEILANLLELNLARSAK